MTKKRMLQHLITDKNCERFYIAGICKECPLSGRSCYSGTVVYDKAIAIYLELYGKEELVEVLI